MKKQFHFLMELLFQANDDWKKINQNFRTTMYYFNLWNIKIIKKFEKKICLYSFVHKPWEIFHDKMIKSLNKSWNESNSINQVIYFLISIRNLPYLFIYFPFLFMII